MFLLQNNVLLFYSNRIFPFCNTQNANKYYTCKYENIKIGSLKCSSLFACLSYTEYDSSIFSTFFVFSRVLNELDEDEFKIEYTTRTYLLNFSWENIYDDERKSAWVFKECHSLCSVFSSCDIMSCKQLRNNSSRLVIYLFT